MFVMAAQRAASTSENNISTDEIDEYVWHLKNFSLDNDMQVEKKTLINIFLQS